MLSETDYQKKYTQALTAYSQEDYRQADKLINSLAQEFPNDPNVFLLKGHIHLGQHQHELAQQQYELVLQLTEQREFVEYANQGLEQIQQAQSQPQKTDVTPDEEQALDMGELPTRMFSEADLISEDNSEEIPVDNEFLAGIMDADSSELSEGHWEVPTPDREESPANPFISQTDISSKSVSETMEIDEANPFPATGILENSLEWQESSDNQSWKFPFSEISGEEEDEIEEEIDENFRLLSSAQKTVLTFRDERDEILDDTLQTSTTEEEAEDEQYFSVSSQETILNQDTPSSQDQSNQQQNLLEELEDLNAHDLDNISDLDLTGIAQNLPDSDWFDRPDEEPIDNQNLELDLDNKLGQGESLEANFTRAPLQKVETLVEVNSGLLSPLANVSLNQKSLITAGVTGVISAIAVLTFSLTGLPPELEPNQEQISAPSGPTNLLLTPLVAGFASFGTALIMGYMANRSIKKTTKDLQTQFEAINQGSFNAKATVYAKDELGELSTYFNQMMRQLLTLTTEVQRRAAETEQSKEEWQRQVIRLLDEVEGAASGDLTVKAEVTADVLGAVADAFNLTIENLRTIVRQVKEAALQVHQSANDSESFARNQSKEALRMAEELAVTLNSVQLMTDSIQRVAEKAKEAEEVARCSSETAVRGGKAVERTVTGILQIREKVSDTTRKVKRLAEASQEISQIVNTISNIAARTNLLALNASIESAKAGGKEGRGFAVVADEVRQLADRVAKALQEIEHIVLRIQSETRSVMTAMEEGREQVKDVTNRAEQAKQALDDIIKVANHIDELVRSITENTEEQRQNSQIVAQVMQSVEKTAQETSQESRRVAGALQNLVSISQELLTSVKRFYTDKDKN